MFAHTKRDIASHGCHAEIVSSDTTLLGTALARIGHGVTVTSGLPGEVDVGNKVEIDLLDGMITNIDEVYEEGLFLSNP